jgi:hypothetical protein
MTDVSELIKKVFHLTADEEGEVREDYVSVKWDLLFTIGKTLEAQAAQITDLEARLRIAEKRAEDAEGRDDFLMEILHMTPEELKELRELIKERKQS